MNASTAVNLLIGLAVLALLVYRQLQVRPVRANFRLPLILAVLGVIQLSQSSRWERTSGTTTWSTARAHRPASARPR